MKKSTNMRNTMLIFSVLAFAVSLSLYWYFRNATSEIMAETLAARKMVLDNQISKIQGKELVRISEESRAKRERLNALFVPAENAVSVIQDIEAIGDSSGAAVSISSIKAAGQVTAAVSITGLWPDVMQAIELFETLPHQKTIRNLSLNFLEAAGPKDSFSRWQASFDISVATIPKI